MEFGDVKTADVLLTLVPETLGPYHVHSKVLSQADFFKAQLSETWIPPSDGKTSRELVLKGCKDTRKYVKFLEFLYTPEQERHFCSVEEALDILEVAAQLLCTDCISSCMKYLGDVTWSSKEEQEIRSCISSFNLTPLPDLYFRLSSAALNLECEMKNMLGKLMSLADRNPQDRDVAHELISKNVEDGEFAALSKDALLQDLKKNIQVMKRKNASGYDASSNYDVYPKLTWLLDEFQQFNMDAIAIEVLASDKELAMLVLKHVESCTCYELKSHSCHLFVEHLNRLFQEIGNGEVVVSKPIRMGLLVSWSSLFVKASSKTSSSLRYTPRPVIDWIEDVMHSLPMENQQTIINLWMDLGFHRSNLLTELFKSWCSKLRKAGRERTENAQGNKGWCSKRRKAARERTENAKGSRGN